MYSSLHRCSYFPWVLYPNGYSLSTLFCQKIFFFSGFYPIFRNIRTGVRCCSLFFNSFFNKHLVSASANLSPNCHLSSRLCLLMDNGKWIMENEGVAFGDIFLIISEGNTTIIHYQLSIIHSCVSTTNGNWQVSHAFFLVSSSATATAVTPPASFPTITAGSISGANPAVKPKWSPKTKAALTAKATFTTLPR